ncbi:enhanced intracellular survival protein Eis, partial [Liquorilactobacillus satsumensis]|uniref:GNAT family N-acetyltransferase n=1 Tax=Liquorilactobacillus satsumensis TaxID=259059 RepID=UPI0039ED59E1
CLSHFIKKERTMAPKKLTTIEDLDRFYQLFCQVFKKEDTAQFRKSFLEMHANGTVLGITKNSQLLSGLAWWCFEVSFQGVSYKMGAVGSVMTAPFARGQGSATQLLQAALAQMAEAGVTLSYLDPFSHAFYRRLGYGAAIKRLYYTIDPAQLQLPTPLVSRSQQATGGSLQTGPLSRYLDKVAPFYAQQLTHKSGGLLRPQWWWEHLHAVGTKVGCYLNAQQQLEGYFLYQELKESWVVKEWLVTNIIAEKNLLQLLHAQKQSLNQLIFESDETLYRGQLLNEPLALSAQVKPFMMVRIINLRDFILHYPFKKLDFGELSLAVTDPQLPQNDGLWRLCAKNGCVSFKKCGSAAQAADISLPIAEFGPLFGGQYSLEWAAFQQKISVSAPYQAVKLQTALLASPVSFNDDF